MSGVVFVSKWFHLVLFHCNPCVDDGADKVDEESLETDYSFEKFGEKMREVCVWM